MPWKWVTQKDRRGGGRKEATKVKITDYYLRDVILYKRDVGEGKGAGGTLPHPSCVAL